MGWSSVCRDAFCNVKEHVYEMVKKGPSYLLEKLPNQAAWKALKCLLEFSVKVGYLASDYLIVAHSDISDMVSPGDPVRRELTKWSNYKHN